jgi:2-phosphosulfolactate phosphatase
MLNSTATPDLHHIKNSIQLYFTSGGVHEDLLKGSRTVVIDVLRAAPAIVTALDNHAKYVIPAPSVAAASNLASQVPRDDLLLCGERDAQIIDGFDLGNSPTEYTYDKVNGKRIIYASTNGSPAIVKCAGAKSVFICGFINLNAVIDAIVALKDRFPLIIICAGNYNQFSLEDSVCGGVLIQRLQKKLDLEPEMNDGARAAEKLATEFGKDFVKLLHETGHGKYLESMGYANDLEICAADSIFDVVPVLQDGRLITLRK